MQSSKSYAVLFLIGAFVAGIAVGVTADRAYTHDGHVPPGPARPDQT